MNASIAPGLLDGVTTALHLSRFRDHGDRGRRLRRCWSRPTRSRSGVALMAAADAGPGQCEEGGDQRPRRPDRRAMAGTTRSAATPRPATTSSASWSPTTPRGAITPVADRPPTTASCPASAGLRPGTNPTRRALQRAGPGPSSIWGKAPGGIRSPRHARQRRRAVRPEGAPDGAITAEEFVTLNEIVGGIDRDSNPQPHARPPTRRRSTSPTAPASC